MFPLALKLKRPPQRFLNRSELHAGASCSLSACPTHPPSCHVTDNLKAQAGTRLEFRQFGDRRGVRIYHFLFSLSSASIGLATKFRFSHFTDTLSPSTDRDANRKPSPSSASHLLLSSTSSAGSLLFPPRQRKLFQPGSQLILACSFYLARSRGLAHSQATRYLSFTKTDSFHTGYLLVLKYPLITTGFSVYSETMGH